MLLHILKTIKDINYNLNFCGVLKMNLEDEIKQTKFRSEFQKLAVNMMFTHNWLVKNHTELLKKFDLTIAQYNILRILRGQLPKSASINLLKDRMIIKTSDASRLIERLRTKKLIERKISRHDRRRSEVKITRKGIDVLSNLDVQDKDFDQLLNNLTITEAKSLNDLLDKVRN